MAATIYIAAGHGGSDPGACAGAYIEKVLTLKTALACRDYLKDYDCNILLARAADQDCTVASKMKEIEKKRPSLVLEIHYNAGGGEGCEVYYWYQHTPSKALAQAVLSEMVRLGQKSRGIKESKSGTSYNFGMCRQASWTNIPSILGEYAFVDNAKDQAKINTDAKLRAIGEAYAKAAIAYLGLQKKAEPQPETDTSSKVQVGDIVQFAGGPVYVSSSAASAASTRGASQCKVTAIAPGAKHPLHLISQDGKGVYGWVNAFDRGTGGGTAPVHPANRYEAGRKITLSNVPLYASSTAKDAARKLSGTYYLYDGKAFSGRYRITPRTDMVGKTPVASYVTGYISQADIP